MEAAGADFIGFVVDPESKRYVPLARAVELGLLCRSARPVLVARRLEVPDVPLHFVRQANDHVAPASGAEHWLSTDGSAEPPTFVDLLLLDAHSERGMGGTGNRVSEEFAAEVVRSSRIPVVLAGGLGPDNVAEAIAAVRPSGVDACSGTESKPGVKDPDLVRAFVRIAQEALHRAHRGG
ncbi:MAG: N-(5'-phosphoribosyl)anthranilate isomerase [Fimbriimonadaceae bacterium]